MDTLSGHYIFKELFMIYENTEKNINDNKNELMDPLYYLKNVLVTSDSDQLTLPHCPPIHIMHCSDCFCRGSDDKSGSFL